MLAQLQDRIRFQKRAVNKLVREITAADRYADSGYVRNFLREFRSFEAVTDLAEVIRRAGESDVVYVGDYHALRESQRFAVGLVERLARSRRPVVLGLELFYSRNQHCLDDYLAGRIGEEELLLRVRYQSEWGFPWENYAPLLRLARQRRLRCLALDCSPRGDLRALGRRDSAAAKKIAGLLAHQPGTLLCVLFGESHLASHHLPGKVAALLQARGHERRSLVVLQNLDGLFWRLAATGQEGAPAVRIDRNRYCVFNSSPLAKYAAYHHCLENWQQGGAEPDATSTVYHLIDTLAAYLKINKYSYCLGRSGAYAEYLVDHYPEVYSAAEAETVTELLDRYGFDQGQRARVLAGLRGRGCCYVPRLNAFFVERFDVEQMAEQAAHFLQHALSGRIYEQAAAPAAEVDRFYASVISQALAQFSARLVAGRPHLTLVDHLANGRPDRVEPGAGLTAAQAQRLTALIELNGALARRRRGQAKLLAAVMALLSQHRAVAQAAIECLGRQLGQQVSDALINGSLGRSDLRKLFGQTYPRAGSAARAYLRLSRRMSP